MVTIFITGANRGIGLELTEQWLKKGAEVLATYRNAKRAQRLYDIKDEHPTQLSLFPLDVCDEDDIDNLQKSLAGKPIDILILNAGVYPSEKDLQSIETEKWLSAFETNTIAPVMITRALTKNLENSEKKLVASVSSLMGSIEDNHSGHSLMYRSTKSALNSAMRTLSIDLAPAGIKFLLMHPGWVQTDMGGSNAPTTVQDSVHGLISILENADQYKTGAFVGFDGQLLPW